MRARARKVLAHGVGAIALGGVFAAAAALGVVVHANAEPTRRLAGSVANDAVAKLFMGRLQIGEVKELHLGPWGHVRIQQVEVLDPEGHRVLLAKDVNGRIDLTRLVRSIAKDGTPELVFSEARIDEVDAAIDVDAAGGLGIARAFVARPSATPKKPEPPRSPDAEDVRLSIPSVQIRHARVHGNVVPPKLDADADDVRARVSISDNRLDLTVEQATMIVRDPRAPGQSGDVRARATGAVTVPLSASAHAMTQHWELDGDAAGIPLKAHFAMDGDVLDASVDVAPVQADVVRRAVPLIPLSRPVELHARVHGKLPTLELTLDGKIGSSTIRGSGAIGVRESQPFHFDADLAQIDAAAFDGPPSDISGHVHVDGAIGGGAPAGKFTVTTQPSTVAAQSAPAISAEGTFDSKTVDASFRASEPGVDVSGTVRLRIPEKALAFDVDARSKALQTIARAPGIASGSGTAHAKGNIDLATSTIDAQVSAEATGVSRAPASAASLHADARVAGPLASPTIDVTARARDVRLTAAAAGKNGETSEPLAYPSATAHARIVLTPSPRILDGEVHVDGADGRSSIDATATEVLLGPGGVMVRGGHVKGLGAPLDLDVQVQNGVRTIRAKATDLDVQRIAAMTGIRELRMLPEGSRATLDIDVKGTQARTDGHVDVTIAGAKDGSAAELHATFDGHHARGRARVAAGALGWVDVSAADIDLAGPLGAKTLERATGALDVRGEIDLAQGAALFGGESIERISGRALLSARLERYDARNLPTVYATASTRALDVTFRPC